MPLASGLAPVTSGLFGFRPWYAQNVNTVTYAVLATDTGTLFTTTGGATVTFTLPTLANGIGCVYWFYNTQGFNMAITAPTNKLIAFNNATGTTATYSTAGNLIGSFCMVFMNDAGTFYHHCNLGGTTVTIT